MEAALITPKLVAYTKADWFEQPIRLWIGDKSSPRDLTGASGAMGLRAPRASANAIAFSTGDGSLTITLPNEIGITVPQATMETLAPGRYAFDITVTFASGDIETIAAGFVEIRQGLAG